MTTAHPLAKLLAVTALAAAWQLALAQATPGSSSSAPSAVPGGSTLCGGMTGSALDDCLARQSRSTSGSSSALPPSTTGVPGSIGGTNPPSSVGGSTPGASSVGGISHPNSGVGSTTGGALNSSVGTMGSGMGITGNSGSGSSSGPLSRPSTGNVRGSSLSR